MKSKIKITCKNKACYLTDNQTNKISIKHPYRVFVSYSHENQNEAKIVCEHLKKIGVQAVSDHLLSPGMPFGDEIKRHITYAHIFIPLVTESSNQRPWVHQEVGYAIGMGVPILPLAIERVPEGLVHQIQSIVVKKDMSDLNEKLTPLILDVVFEHASRTTSGITIGPHAPAPSYQCTHTFPHRTQMLIDNARDIRLLGKTGKVRFKAPFGSFALPNEPATMPIWDAREDGRKHDDDLRELLRMEREELEIHARNAGCRLILADDPLKTKQHSPKSTATRLNILKDFLNSCKDDMVDIVFQSCQKMDSNIIILGDWFMAEAIVPLIGDVFRLTVFTRHGPSVLKRIRDFDREFDALQAASGWTAGKSRKPAIERLTSLINKLESK